MAKQTLLEMVKDILSTMDSDNVNSISDTIEATQVARIIRNIYDNYISTEVIPETYQLTNLQALGDVDKPSHMKFPSNTINVEWIKYNIRKSGETRDNFKELEYRTPYEFVQLLSSRDPSDTNIKTVTGVDNSKLFIRTDKYPDYYTSFDNEYIVFDSYDSAVDSTLQEVKTLAFLSRYETFLLEDSFVPNLADTFFPMLLEEARSTAHVTLKTQLNEKAEQWANRTRNSYDKSKYKIRKANQTTLVNYGRK
jgi:hypothetical protein